MAHILQKSQPRRKPPWGADFLMMARPRANKQDEPTE